MGSSLFGDYGNYRGSGSESEGLFDTGDSALDEKDLELSQRASYLRSLSPGFRSALSAPAPAPERPKHGPLRTAWDYGTAPLKAIAGLTGTLSAQLTRPFVPDAYNAAAAELEAENAGYGPELTKPLENLPGLGDVAAQGISKEGLTGSLLRPVARIGLNILGDPTSYFGAGILSRIPKVGKLASELGQAQKAIETLTTAGRLEEAAELTPQVTRLAGMLSEATAAESAVGRGARTLLETGEGLGRSGATGEALRSAALAPSFAQAVRGVGRAGATLPFSPLVGLAYAPELAESIAGQAGSTIESVKQGKYAEAAASGAGALLTAGLARMVSKGVMQEAKAAGILERSLAEQLGERPVRVPPAEEPAVESPALMSTPAAPAPREAPPPPAGLPPEVAPELPPGALQPEPVPAPVPVPVESPALTQPPTQPLPVQAPVPPITDAPQPSAPAPLTPLPGTDRIKVERSPENTQKLADLIEARSISGQQLTKKDLVDAGLVSKKQSTTYNMEELLDSFGLTEMRGRLEFDPKSGGGYKVRAVERAPEPAEPAQTVQAAQPTQASQAAPTPPEPRLEAAPAQAVEPPELIPVERTETPAPPQTTAPPASPEIPEAFLESTAAAAESDAARAASQAAAGPGGTARVPRELIDRRIAAFEMSGDAEGALREIAQSGGKEFGTLTKEDVRATFPGDENHETRGVLNRVLYAVQKKERMAAREAEQATAQAARAAAEPDAPAGMLSATTPPTPVTPAPGMAAAARALEGELSGGGGGGGGGEKPAAPTKPTPGARKVAPIPDKPATPAPAPTKSTAPDPTAAFTSAFERYAGPEITSVPAPKSKTAPRASPFERTLNRLHGLTTEQRTTLSAAFEARQAHAGRADSISWDRLDPDLRTTLRLRSADDLADFSKRTGIKDPADWALLRTVTDTFDRDIDRTREALMSAERAGSLSTEDLRGQLAFAGLRRAAVLDTLIPDFGKC